MTAEKHICLGYNIHRQNSIDLADRLRYIIQRELERPLILLPIGLTENTDPEEQYTNIELAIACGGDGTLLSLARTLASAQVPILGLNAGHLGFLTEIEIPSDLGSFLASLLAGEHKTEERMMLAASIDHKDASTGAQKQEMLALNDIVIARSSRSSVLNIHLELDGQPITEYTGDGLIISTPTGSTAYSLAAGGAVLTPSMPAIQIVPICAHSLTSRPLIVDQDSKLKITIEPRNFRQSLVTVQADGQEVFLLEPKEQMLQIEKSPHTTVLMRSNNPKNNFYNLLNAKLLWGKSA